MCSVVEEDKEMWGTGGEKMGMDWVLGVDN
jgi:hypothetical protein